MGRHVLKRFLLGLILAVGIALGFVYQEGVRGLVGDFSPWLENAGIVGPLVFIAIYVVGGR